MPVGRFPVLVRVGVGEPVVVTVKLKAWPAVAVAAAALEIVSPLLTVRVSAWVAVARRVAGGDGQHVAALGSGLGRAGQRRRAVAVVGERHPGGQGRVLVAEMVAAGLPVVVTENVPAGRPRRSSRSRS